MPLNDNEIMVDEEIVEKPKPKKSPYRELVDEAFPKSPSTFNKELAEYLEKVNMTERFNVNAVNINSKIKELIVTCNINEKQDTLLRTYQVFMKKNERHDGFYLMSLLLEKFN